MTLLVKKDSSEDSSYGKKQKTCKDYLMKL